MKIIAEIGLAHEGSLGQAIAYCKAVAKAGADIVKFQCHHGDTVSRFRPGTQFPQDKTRQGYWRRTGFSRTEWDKLFGCAGECGVRTCVSVFSPEAVALLDGLPIDYWKLGSAQTSDIALIEQLTHRDGELIISTGMSDWQEIDSAVCAACRRGRYPTVMQCTSTYPCPPERVGLGIMDEMRRKYDPCKVGLSDHSGTIWPSVAAAAQGADFCEVHVCWSRECFGADVKASITIDELRQLVNGVRFIEKMLANSVDKDEQASTMGEMRELFRGSAT